LNQLLKQGRRERGHSYRRNRVGRRDSRGWFYRLSSRPRRGWFVGIHVLPDASFEAVMPQETLRPG